MHGTCGLNNPWHHLRKMSSWVGNPGRPGNHNLLQQVTLPTRVTDTNATLIDHVYTRSNKTLQTDVIICDISDHYPTLTKYLNEKAPTKEQKITKRWFKEESYNDIREALEDKEDTWQLMHDLPLDEATNLQHKTIQDILDKVAPIETKTLSNKPINRWLTTGIKISLNNAEKQYKKVKQGKLQKSEYKTYKKILESCICLLYTSPSPRDRQKSRMPSSA